MKLHVQEILVEQMLFVKKQIKLVHARVCQVITVILTLIVVLNVQ